MWVSLRYPLNCAEALYREAWGKACGPRLVS